MRSAAVDWAAGTRMIDKDALMADTGSPRIVWDHDWDTAFDRARRERRLVLVDVEKDR